jgi:hypothetical protein
LENRKIKILEPNKGKHIAIVGDINTILAFKEDTGGTYSFIEARGLMQRKDVSIESLYIHQLSVSHNGIII